LKKLKKLRREMKQRIRATQHCYIKRCIKKIKIDHLLATSEIEQSLQTADENHYSSWIRQRDIVDAIQRKEWAMAVCRFGRVHYGLTYLKKSLRRYLSVDGQELVGVDVSCCHPLLVGVMCQEEYKKRPNDMASLPPDLIEYMRLCSSGLLYEELVKGIGDINHDRKWVKHAILSQVFYGENVWRGPLIDAMDRKFPSVMAIVRSVKALDFKRLSHDMLRLESQIIIDSAVLECAKRGIWIATIHDCLVCLPDDIENVTEVMAKAFAKYDVVPHVKAKLLAEDAVEARNETPTIAKAWEPDDGSGIIWS
jgi:hypothetical protein